MKRVTLHLSPSVLVPDDTDVIDLQTAVVNKVMHLADQTWSVESVGVGRADVKDVRGGVCKVGPHAFVVDSHFPESRPVPDICREHWYEQAMTDAHDEHRPLFDELERMTGLKGHIEQTGGMTMTVVIPLPEAGTEGDEQGFPCYMALKEGEGDGEWGGSIGFYNHYEDYDNVVWTSEGGAATPQEWAAKIAEHYKGWRSTHPLPEATT